MALKGKLLCVPLTFPSFTVQHVLLPLECLPLIVSFQLYSSVCVSAFTECASLRSVHSQPINSLKMLGVEGEPG